MPRLIVFAMVAFFCLSCSKESPPLAPPSSLHAAKATTSVATDRAALVALYHATDGDNWGTNTNWLSNAPLDSWAGVDTDPQGRVETLWMTGNRLRGTIPVQLGRMDKLKWLRLNLNELTGTIPSQLGSLTNLFSLLLDNNQLAGTIPASLGQLPKLQTLNMHNNQLTGSIPASLGNLSGLIILNMYNNQLTGSIPASLGQLPKLREVRVRGNRFTGCLPVGWRNLLDVNTDLDESGLDFCSEEGNIPEVPESNFNIELRFVEDIPVAYQNQLELAAARFERVILSDLPDIDFKTWPVNEYNYHLRKRVVVNQPVDDLLVLVGTRDEPGGVASAGVMRIRVRGKLPVVATLTLDVDALSDNASEDVYSTMLHELSHCLGFGLVWEQLGLIKGYRNPLFHRPHRSGAVCRPRRRQV